MSERYIPFFQRSKTAVNAPLTITDLLVEEVLNFEIAAWLWYMIEKGASGIIIGPSGSGKTTLLNALLPIVPLPKRVCVIDEAEEQVAPDERHIADESVRQSPCVTEGHRSVRVYEKLVSGFIPKPGIVMVSDPLGRRVLEFLDSGKGSSAVYGTVEAKSMEDMMKKLPGIPYMGGSESQSLLNYIDFVIRIEQISVPGTGGFRRRVTNIWEKDGSVVPKFSMDDRGNGLFSYVEKEDSYLGPSTGGFEGYLVDRFALRGGNGLKRTLKDLDRRVAILTYLVEERDGLSTLQKFLIMNSYTISKKWREEWENYAYDQPYGEGV